MPIYEYLCLECGEVTEILVRGSGKTDAVCAKCGSQRVERKFSTFATGGASSGDFGDACSGST